ncbi:hypothetical protein CRP_095 [Candidatus Carsonella ruddii PV]|uniref:Large ribosomal subunit protein bL32 n=1 Tax=Carsonella ruddii (strain PV) TaxID=387662 RepID=RL32_CARRP|nr:RecName: Full=Large ribosomal subunit protein bL32; AltName: Full=50S ribosomal protein L32 [Candidatus Carsonella ruddii PV]BAF35126.1 hypothetical protein CRP_095 [Candidatus Carsonella ruddii PV]
MAVPKQKKSKSKSRFKKKNFLLKNKIIAKNQYNNYFIKHRCLV